MAGVFVCFLISLSLFLSLGAAFERRERFARGRNASRTTGSALPSRLSLGRSGGDECSRADERKE